MRQKKEPYKRDDILQKRPRHVDVKETKPSLSCLNIIDSHHSRVATRKDTPQTCESMIFRQLIEGLFSFCRTADLVHGPVVG